MSYVPRNIIIKNSLLFLLVILIIALVFAFSQTTGDLATRCFELRVGQVRAEVRFSKIFTFFHDISGFSLKKTNDNLLIMEVGYHEFLEEIINNSLAEPGPKYKEVIFNGHRAAFAQSDDGKGGTWNYYRIPFDDRTINVFHNFSHLPSDEQNLANEILSSIKLTEEKEFIERMQITTCQYAFGEALNPDGQYAILTTSQYIYISRPEKTSMKKIASFYLSLLAVFPFLAGCQKNGALPPITLDHNWEITKCTSLQDASSNQRYGETQTGWHSVNDLDEGAYVYTSLSQWVSKEVKDVVLEATSPSGDWYRIDDYCFNSNGDVIQLYSDLRTFHGEVQVIRTWVYQPDGSIGTIEVNIIDMKSGQSINPGEASYLDNPPYIAKNYQDLLSHLELKLKN